MRNKSLVAGDKMKVETIGFWRCTGTDTGKKDSIEINKINSYTELLEDLHKKGFKRKKGIGTNGKYETASTWIHDSGIELHISHSVDGKRLTLSIPPIEIRCIKELE